MHSVMNVCTLPYVPIVIVLYVSRTIPKVPLVLYVTWVYGLHKVMAAPTKGELEELSQGTPV